MPSSQAGRRLRLTKLQNLNTLTPAAATGSLSISIDLLFIY